MPSSMQLSLGVEPGHRNQYLFSDHYLDELLPDEKLWRAFVKALASSVPNLSALVEVYRARSPDYRDLTRRLALTDRLIDQIFYKLYGLTEGEIAIVEGD